VRCVVLYLGLLSAGGCGLGRSGLLEPAGTGDSTTTHTGGTGGASTTTTSSHSTTTSSSSGGGSGGTGPVAACDNGVIENGEQCEDGNSTAGDGCSAECTFEASCGNNIVEPGEACDAATDCVACQVSGASRCVSALALPLGNFTGSISASATGFGNPAVDFSQTDCSDAPASVPVALYRYEVSPYPEGLAVFARGDGVSFLDAVVWSYRGCLGAPVACSDDGAYLNMGDDATMVTPVEPAGTILFVAVASWSGYAGGFGAFAHPFRHWALFDVGPANYTLGGGWVSGVGSIQVSGAGTAFQATAQSPDIYVAGIETIDIVFQQTLSLSASSTASIEASFDGGAWVPTSFANVTLSDLDTALDTAQIARPAQAQQAKIRFVFNNAVGSVASWSVAGVLVGPAP